MFGFWKELEKQEREEKDKNKKGNGEKKGRPKSQGAKSLTAWEQRRVKDGEDRPFNPPIDSTNQQTSGSQAQTVAVTPSDSHIRHVSDDLEQKPPMVGC